MPYAVGWNTPGHLPEMEPWLFADFDDARDALAAELAERADDPDQGPEDEADYRQAAKQVAAWTASTVDAGDTVYAARLAYWIHQITDAEYRA